MLNEFNAIRIFSFTYGNNSCHLTDITKIPSSTIHTGVLPTAQIIKQVHAHLNTSLVIKIGDKLPA